MQHKSLSYCARVVGSPEKNPPGVPPNFCGSSYKTDFTGEKRPGFWLGYMSLSKATRQQATSGIRWTDSFQGTSNNPKFLVNPAAQQ